MVFLKINFFAHFFHLEHSKRNVLSENIFLEKYINIPSQFFIKEE